MKGYIMELVQNGTLKKGAKHAARAITKDLDGAVKDILHQGAASAAENLIGKAAHAANKAVATLAVKGPGAAWKGIREELDEVYERGMKATAVAGNAGNADRNARPKK